MTSQTMLYLVKQVELGIRARLEETVSPAGLTSLQYTALTVLERRPGITAAELARNSFIRAQSMAQVVTQLEGTGLLRRERDPNSRRQFLMFLTERAQTLLDELRPRVATVEASMLDGLDLDEVGSLRQMLRRCRENLGGREAH